MPSAAYPQAAAKQFLTTNAEQQETSTDVHVQQAELIEPAPSAQPEQPTQTLSTDISSSEFLRRAQDVSWTLNQMLRFGNLHVRVIGTNQPNSVGIGFNNDSDKAISLHLVPGIMLVRNDGFREVQPVMVAEDILLTLAPHTASERQIQSFLLNSSSAPPSAARWSDCRFSSSAKDWGAANVRVLLVAKQITLQPSTLPEPEHRAAVSQLALWKSMGQPVGLVQLQVTIGSDYKVQATRSAVFSDCERVLASAL